GILILLAVAVILVPPLIDLGAYKGRYLPQVEEALQRKVDVGEIRLRIVPSPAIRVSALQISDNPAFSEDPFFSAETVSLRLKLMALFSGHFQVEEFILEKPVVHLIKKPDGTFNFADIAKKKEETAKKEKDTTSEEAVKLGELIPAVLRLDEGVVTLQTVGQKPLQISGVDISLQNFSADRPFPYRIALTPPGLKPVSLEGQMRYQDTQSVLTLNENRLNAAGVDFAVNGTIINLTSAPRLDLSLVNDRFDIGPIVQLLSSAGIAPPEFDASGPVGLRTSVRGPSNNVLAQIAVKLENLKVTDSRAFKGNVAGQLQLSVPSAADSPIRSMRGDGRLAARDGELTNVDLVKKIEQITGLIGMSQQQREGATTFKTLETEFGVANGIADFKRIHLVSAVMEAQGAGKMNLEAQTLDLGIEAALASDISARAGGGKAGTFFKDNQGRIVVPLTISGAAKSPAVNIDTKKLVTKGLGSILQDRRKGSPLDRLFRGR
ncbi:MAG TPA: AsmA family protein, partial [Candidatus Binatia bacterium]|nr:AsmA family protein [Candidatus Binatia bacterium]